MQARTPILLRRISIGLTILGILNAGYLTYVHLAHVEVLCSGVGGCDTVQNSRYSEVAGIPVAAVGLAGYLAILAMLATEEIQGPLHKQALILLFGMTLLGTLYSAYLTYLELFVIGAICPYCTGSAVVMVVLFIITLFRMLQDNDSEEEQAAG
jgi:uncharacterized membrane protein